MGLRIAQIAAIAGSGSLAPAAPVNTILPVIFGTPQEGQTLTCLPGNWTGFPRPTYAFQWFADGSEIEGATSNTLLLTSNEVGAVITCVVTATNSVGSDDAVSAGVGPVEPEEAGGGGIEVILGSDAEGVAQAIAYPEDLIVTSLATEFVADWEGPATLVQATEGYLKLHEWDGVDNFKMVVLAADGDLLAVSDPETIGSGGNNFEAWVKFTFSEPATLEKGVAYRPGYIADDGSHKIYASAGGEGVGYSEANSYADPTDYVGAGIGDADVRPSFYLTGNTTGEEGDVTAPILSSAQDGTPTPTGTVGAGVTTNESGGTLYWAVVTDGGACSDAQLKAGSGGNIVAGKAGSQAVGGIGAQSIANITGLAPATDYQIKFLHRDASGNDSDQASVNLTTEEAVGPTISAASGAVGQGEQWELEGSGFCAENLADFVNYWTSTRYYHNDTFSGDGYFTAQSVAYNNDAAITSPANGIRQNWAGVSTGPEPDAVEAKWSAASNGFGLVGLTNVKAYIRCYIKFTTAGGEWLDDTWKLIWGGNGAKPWFLNLDCQGDGSAPDRALVLITGIADGSFVSSSPFPRGALVDGEVYEVIVGLPIGTGGDGHFTLHWDGELIYDVAVTGMSITSWGIEFGTNGWNSSSDFDQDMDVDGLCVATSGMPARASQVYLADGDDFETANLVPQFPTRMLDDTLQFRMDLTGLDDEGPLYLFVENAQGQVSAAEEVQAGSAPAEFAIVQQGTPNIFVNQSGNQTVTLEDVAAGNMIAVHVCGYRQGATTAAINDVTDDNGTPGVGTKPTPQTVAGADSIFSAIFIIPNAPAGTHTIGWNPGGISTWGRLHAVEWSGAATASPVDKAATPASSNTPAGDVTVGPTAELAQAHELVLTGLCLESDTAINTPSGYTNLDKSSGSANVGGHFAYKIVNATDGVSAAHDWTASEEYQACLCTIKAAA